MRFSFKSIGNLAGKAIGAAAGGFFGGPAGAVAGYEGSNAILGAVGLGDDQLAAAEQWKWQKKAADYKYAQDLNMWNLVNAYNDPAAQMERLQRAGLNPNLVYGGNNVTGNTSSSGPEYANIDPGYTDRNIQRRQLALALEEHQQRITNQAIENDLARQRLVLAERDADRSDALAQAQISAYKAGLGLAAARIDDIGLKDRRTSYEKTRDFFMDAGSDIGTWLAGQVQKRQQAKHWHKTGTSRSGKTTFTTYGRKV